MNFKIKTLDKFIFSQVFAATLAALILFVIVWIAPETLVKIIRKITQQGMPFSTAGMLLLYEIPKVLMNVLPISILLGSLFTFDKLSKDSELAILRSSGLSFSRIIRPIIFLGIGFSLFCFLIVDQAMPWACKSTNEDAHFDEHFVYVQHDEYKNPLQAVIISNFTHIGIKNLIITNFHNDENYSDVAQFDSILFADYALKKNGHWLLPTAVEYKIAPSGIYKKIENVKNVKILEGEDADVVYRIMLYGTKRDRAFTTAGLFQYIKLLKQKNIFDEYNFMLSKFFQRFLHPLNCVLFAILGALLGYAPPRSVKYLGFVFAAVILFSYYITIPFFDVLASKSVLPPFVCAALPFAIFISLIFIIKKQKDL